MKKKASDPYHPTSIIRLWPDQIMDDSLWKSVLDMLTRHPGACDEIWFATEPCFPPLEKHRLVAKKTGAAAEDARSEGFLAGLQIANTIGHADRPAYDHGGSEAFQVLVDHDGRQANGCFCPRGEAFNHYFREVGRIYATFQPSSVWIDDDLRLNYHAPVTWGCFCDSCLALFTVRSGQKWTRKTLVQALHDPVDGQLRLSWTHFNEESMAFLARSIAEAVHGVATNCVMAVQTCPNDWSLYNGRNYSEVFEAMHEATGHSPVGNRPGVLVYTDHAPRQMVDKAYWIGRSVAMQPDCVSVATAEVENYPHVSTGKTPRGTAVEASLDLALGCDSVSFAVICNNYESMDFYESIVAQLDRYRGFWDCLLKAGQDTFPGGLYIPLSDRHVARPLTADERLFSWASVNLSHVYQMACMGIPLTVNPLGAQGTVVCRESVPGLTDDELKAVLSGGVLLDGHAALAIRERGKEDWLGIHVEPLKAEGCLQRFSDDEINTMHRGYPWRYAATTVSGGTPARILSFNETPDGSRVGPATVLAENALGGRLAIFGYDLFKSPVSEPLRQQIYRAADWTCRGALPVLVNAPSQMLSVPRVTKAGELKTVFLLNPTIDSSPPVALSLRAVAAEQAVWHVPGHHPVNLPLQDGNNEKKISLPEMEAWSVGFLELSNE